MREEMNRLTDEMGRLFGRWGVASPRMFAASAYPPIDLWADDDNLYLEAELPGLGLDDLEIFVTGNQLTLKGERKLCEVKGGTWHRQERGYGTFNRVVELPCDVDHDKVSAEFKHGVLTITLPKCAEIKPRRIEVKAS
jgi:HSP20 family protein